LRGGLIIDSDTGTASVAHLCRHPHIDRVQSVSGTILPPSEQVKLGEKIKTVLLGGRSVLLVSPLETAAAGVAWQTCDKEQLKKY
jgi:hypothetical protein